MTDGGEEKMRMIDADKIRIPHKRDDIYYRNTYNSGVTAVVHAIGRVPTIEAEPVMHGRWEWLGPYRGNGDGWIGTCSVCKKRLRVFEKSYCPNCGAKMDLRGDQDE